MPFFMFRPGFFFVFFLLVWVLPSDSLIHRLHLEGYRHCAEEIREQHHILQRAAGSLERRQVWLPAVLVLSHLP